MSSTNENELKKEKKTNIRWMLAVYDVLIFAIVSIILLVLYGGMDKLSPTGILQQVCLSFVCIFGGRFIGKNLQSDLAIWWNPMLCQIVLYRCDCILHLSVSGVDSSSSKNYFCKNAFVSKLEFTWSISTSHDVSLCI